MRLVGRRAARRRVCSARCVGASPAHGWRVLGWRLARVPPTAQARARPGVLRPQATAHGPCTHGFTPIEGAGSAASTLVNAGRGDRAVRALNKGVGRGGGPKWGRQSRSSASLVHMSRGHGRGAAGRKRARAAAAAPEQPATRWLAPAAVGGRRRAPAPYTGTPPNSLPACAGRRGARACVARAADGGRRRSAGGRTRPASSARAGRHPPAGRPPPRRPRSAPPPRPARRTDGVGEAHRQQPAHQHAPAALGDARAAQPRAAAPEEEEPDQRRREHRGEARLRIGYERAREEGDARAEGEGQRARDGGLGRRGGGGGGAGAQGGALERTAAARGASRAASAPHAAAAPPLEGHSQTANTTQTAHNQTHTCPHLQRVGEVVDVDAQLVARVRADDVGVGQLLRHLAREALGQAALRAGGGGGAFVCVWGKCAAKAAAAAARRRPSGPAGRPAPDPAHGNVTPPPPALTRM